MKDTPIEKDFDNLVQEVNKNLAILENKKKNIRTITQNFIASILIGIQNIHIYGNNKFQTIHYDYLGIDTNTLEKYQIDVILLASDWVRAFEKTKEKFEQEKIGKDQEIVKKIDNEIIKAQDIYKMLYNQYKNRFYRK